MSVSGYSFRPFFMALILISVFVSACGKKTSNPVVEKKKAKESDAQTVQNGRSGASGPVWNQIRPIFQKRCFHCHDHNLTDYSFAKSKVGVIAPLFFRGSANSMTLAQIKAKGLTDDEINLVKTWVRNRMPEKVGTPTTSRRPRTTRPSSRGGRRHGGPVPHGPRGAHPAPKVKITEAGIANQYIAMKRSKILKEIARLETSKRYEDKKSVGRINKIIAQLKKTSKKYQPLRNPKAFAYMNQCLSCHGAKKRLNAKYPIIHGFPLKHLEARVSKFISLVDKKKAKQLTPHIEVMANMIKRMKKDRVEIKQILQTFSILDPCLLHSEKHLLIYGVKAGLGNGDIKKGEQLFKTKFCLSCHKKGNAMNYPHLTYQKAGYIDYALNRFHKGTRENAMMKMYAGQLAAIGSGKGIKQISLYLGSKFTSNCKVKRKR